MTTTKTPNKPSHELFTVKDGAESKGVWTKIGAAWPHKDGNGLSLRFSTWPAPGETMHIRAIRRSDSKGGDQ